MRCAHLCSHAWCGAHVRRHMPPCSSRHRQRRDQAELPQRAQRQLPGARARAAAAAGRGEAHSQSRGGPPAGCRALVWRPPRTSAPFKLPFPPTRCAPTTTCSCSTGTRRRPRCCARSRRRRRGAGAGPWRRACSAGGWSGAHGRGASRPAPKRASQRARASRNQNAATTTTAQAGGSRQPVVILADKSKADMDAQVYETLRRVTLGLAKGQGGKCSNGALQRRERRPGVDIRAC